MNKLQGCSHILSGEDCEKIKYGQPGLCVNLLIKKSCGFSPSIFYGAILIYPQTNTIVPNLYFENISSKVLFDINVDSSMFGVSYRYDSSISEVAAHIFDYRSEVFNGEQYHSYFLAKMAEAVIKETGSKESAIRWILFDEAPINRSSLSQFLLDVVYPSKEF